MKPTSPRAQRIANAISTHALKQLHAEFPRILEEDDELEAAGSAPKYGVRVHNDFREWANAIENAFDTRDEPYVPICWSSPP
ncbi:MAG: hypothetical protein ACRBN8_44820 [Nannocystales bacterium]